MKRREFTSRHWAGHPRSPSCPRSRATAFADAATLDELTISDVEILKLSGTHQLVPGLNRQYQVNPLHLYDGTPAEAVQGSAGKYRTRATATDALLRAHSHQGRRRGSVWRRRQGSPARLVGHAATAGHRPERARRRTHLGPDVPLESPFARQPFHDGHQLHRQRVVGSARPPLRRAGVPPAGRPDADAGARVWQLPRILDRSAARGEARGAVEEGRLHSPEVVPGVRTRRRRARHGSQRAARESTARGGGRRRADHVRRLPGLGPAVRHRVVPQGRAVPALLRRRGRAHVGPREFHPPVEGHHRFRLPPANTCTAAGKPSSSSRRTRCSSSRRIRNGAAA